MRGNKPFYEFYGFIFGVRVFFIVGVALFSNVEEN